MNELKPIQNLIEKLQDFLKQNKLVDIDHKLLELTDLVKSNEKNLFQDKKSNLNIKKKLEPKNKSKVL